jgi:hypothetical protein
MPDWLEIWGWTKDTRDIVGLDRTVNYAGSLQDEGILPEIMSADLVILQVSDDTIYRTNYGDLKYVINPTEVPDLEREFTTTMLNKFSNTLRLVNDTRPSTRAGNNTRPAN